MNDEQMQPLLETWFRDTDPTPPDTRQTAVKVMARVPEVRQRGRWWPLPKSDRPVSTFPSRELAPAPIPATNGRQPARGFTMFSALKFLGAGVIVALFGGFLLAGILTTQQGDEVLPAAVSASPTAEAGLEEATEPPDSEPSPTTIEGLLAGLVTEEVEPGVERIISDGAGHDLVRGRLGDINGIAIAPGGTVWLTTAHDDSDVGSLIWALGQPGTYTHEHGLPRDAEIDDLAILADGVLLAIGHRDQVLRLDGGRFVSDDGPMLRQMADGGLLLLMGGADLADQLSEGEVASIRDLHVVWEPPSQGGGGWTMLGDHGRWRVGDHRCWLFDEDEGLTCGGGWDPWTTYLAGATFHRLAAAPDGSVWAVGGYDDGPTGLYRITLPPAE